MPGFPSSQGTVDGIPATMPWLNTAVDPAVSLDARRLADPRALADLAVQAQGFSSDFAMETMGFNLNDLWGEAWEFS